MTEDYGQLTLEFGSAEHEIGAAAYGTVLLDTVTLIEELSNELETGARFTVRVRAERKGSYMSDLVLQAGAVIGVTSSFITPENLAVAKMFASTLLDKLGKCLDLAKKLKGESPKLVINGDVHITLEGDNFGTINVDRSVGKTVLENTKAQEAISELFSALDQEPGVESFKLRDRKKELIFEAKKDEFPALAKRLKPASPKKKSKKVRAELAISRQSFEENKKCDFIYAGNPISASIEDGSFWEAVDRGEKFAKGDRLFTELEIEQEFNEAIQTFENKGYKVLRVLEHRPRPDQQSLPFAKGNGRRKNNSDATMRLPSPRPSKSKKTNKN